MVVPRFRTILFSLLIMLILLATCSTEQRPIFSISTGHLDGTDIRTIYTDASRQATHLRVSPSGQWIMFSRYNEIDPADGLAKENWGGHNHYENTELVMMRADGSEPRVLVPPQTGIMNVNSNWTDDERGFVFVSSDNTKRVPEIRRAVLSSGMEVESVSTFSLPDHLIPVDPHLHRGKMVFPAIDLSNQTGGLWIANEDGSGLRKLTFPRDPRSNKLLKHSEGGDNDPRISPDGSQVVFMRLIAGVALWSIYVVDIESGRERNLSSPYLSPAREMDAVPEWSGDGQQLIFWNVNLAEITFKIVSMRPDGEDRRTVLFSPEVFHQSPAFFPNTGSGPKARIAFSTQQVPAWKLWVARFVGVLPKGDTVPQ